MDNITFKRAIMRDLDAINDMLCRDYVDRYDLRLYHNEDGTYSLYDYDTERSDRTTLDILAQAIETLREQLENNDPLRICNVCGHILFYGGFVVDAGNEYYCGNTCLRTKYSKEEWKRMCEEDEQTYYTEFI